MNHLRFSHSSVALVLVVTSGCSASRQAAGGGDAGVDVGVPVDVSEETWVPWVDGGVEGPPEVDGGGDADDVPAPVRIIRGDPAANWLTLTIEGHGLTGLEGRLVSVRIGRPDRPPERLGSGQTRVENGAFAITFPDGWEAGLYKQKLLFIDMDADGVCTEADQTYSDHRAAVNDTVLTLVGSVPPDSRFDEFPAAPDVAAFCRLWAMPWPDA